MTTAGAIGAIARLALVAAALLTWPAHAQEPDYKAALAKSQAVIGKPVRDWREADAALEEFVLSAGPENDDELIRLFHRWCQAQANTLLHGLTQLPEYGGNRLKFSQILKR